MTGRVHQPVSELANSYRRSHSTLSILRNFSSNRRNRSSSPCCACSSFSSDSRAARSLASSFFAASAHLSAPFLRPTEQTRIRQNQSAKETKTKNQDLTCHSS